MPFGIVVKLGLLVRTLVASYLLYWFKLVLIESGLCHVLRKSAILCRSLMMFVQNVTISVGLASHFFLYTYICRISPFKNLKI